jgi:protein-S-isoprenylcysteine O-methyltransferase Ste14
MSPVVRLAITAAAMVGFFLPFFIFTLRKSEKAVVTAGAARWGILLQSLAFFAVYVHTPAFWNSPIEPWRAAASSVFAILSWLLAWTGPRHLGRQWRIQAALNADHELIQSGPYRIVRHPIYASMLCLFLSACFSCGEWPMWAVGLVLFLAGLETRVRAEDKLLLGRFGARFEKWQSETPAYLPFVR